MAGTSHVEAQIGGGALGQRRKSEQSNPRPIESCTISARGMTDISAMSIQHAAICESTIYESPTQWHLLARPQTFGESGVHGVS